MWGSGLFLPGLFCGKPQGAPCRGEEGDGPEEGGDRPGLSGPLRQWPGAVSSPWAGHPEWKQEPAFFHPLANSVVATEAVWAAKPKIFTVCPFPEIC